jgi:hypothetical protein
VKKPAAKAPVKSGGGGGKGGAAAKAPPAGKHQAKAKAKPAKVSRAVHRARRQAALRGAATRKQHAVQAKKRGLALGSAVACCSHEALAASLRLSGWPVSDADVLALYWHTARDEHAGASILATLEAAGEFGLAGVRPVSFGSAWPRVVGRGAVFQQVPIDEALNLGDRELLRDPLGHECLDDTGTAGLVPAACQPDDVVIRDIGALHGPSVILGLSLPAPHAVLDTGSEWISWGQPWPVSAFPDVAIEEAWEVTWPS